MKKQKRYPDGLNPFYRLRERIGWSAIQAAGHIGMGLNTWKRLERGSIDHASVGLLRRVAGGLGVPLTITLGNETLVKEDERTE